MELKSDGPACPRCRAPVIANAKVMPLSLGTQDQKVDLLAIRCGRCGNNLAIVKG